MGDRGREVGREGFANSGVGHGFGFVEGAMELPERREGGGQHGEIGMFADNVPGAFEN